MTRQGGEPLRICVDARLVSGGPSGGVESVVIGLAHGLSRLDDGNEEFLFLAWQDDDAWIRPQVTGPCRMLYAARTGTREIKLWVRRNVRFVEPAWNGLRTIVGSAMFHAPRSDGAIEGAGVDVMHFTTQFGFLTDIPSIYHPHDLQHRHFPEHFSRREMLFREHVYKELCDQAALVAAASSWIKSDFEKQLGLGPEKVTVVPLAPVLHAYPEPSDEDIQRVRDAYALPNRFILYPAQTWAHKNHLGLLDAVALLRDKGLTIDVICSGHLNEFFSEIDRHRRRLQLESRVRFVGFVSPLELQALYRIATAVVVPSKFEAASGPLWDAFLANTPAACSTVTSLPMQAGDAALLFDPNDPAEIAYALERLWTDEALRRTLAVRGRESVSRFTWDRTARHFRAHYRRVAGRILSDEDHVILSAPPLL